MLIWSRMFTICSDKNNFLSLSVQLRRGFGFLKIFVHHDSPWNLKRALSPCRRGPSHLAVRILPRAFLVFIFRQHEIWPTLVSTKEQTTAVCPWRIDSSNASCLLLVFFLLPTYSLQLTHTQKKASNSHFILCDFSKLWLKFTWQQDGNLAYDMVSLYPQVREQQMVPICKHRRKLNLQNDRRGRQKEMNRLNGNI